MRIYKNKDGDSIIVTKEHLEIAVKIKRELQMSSPSHRCSWVQHKRMMEVEGFFDSENSENYRCLIKNYQSSIGELPSLEKHVDLVTTSKLESIKEAVGEMAYSKKEVQLESRKLGKLKSDLSLFGVVSEQVYNAMSELNMGIPTFAYGEKIVSDKKRKMVVFLSDWHIGSVIVNANGNNYDYHVANGRVKKFESKISDIARLNGITDIEVVCLGDMTEHVNMRQVNQAFETEFNLSVQIVKAFELIRNLLVNLASCHNVTYRGISGNHDRMNGKKDDNIDGDSTIHVINFMVKMFSEMNDMPRIEYVEVDSINYSTVLDINGIKIKCVHGDHEKGNNKIASHSTLDGVLYNVLAMGHLHHYNVKEVGSNQFEAYFGSLMGINNYGVKGKFSSNASQGLIIVDEYGDIDFKRVDLQNV